MVVYYLNKVSERLTDYRYPIKEGDICMLYDGDAVKTIYVDSETETDSIWRDFKFIDSKSLKSYHLPKTDSVLCAPFGEKHAIGDTMLLTQLIQECKGEWLLDFLNETSAVLSGFVDYWDLMVLRRLTGEDDIEIVYGDEEALSAFIVKPEEDEDEELEDEDEEEYTDVDVLPQSNDIKWFCLSVLTCIKDQMDQRSYQILHDTLQGDSRSEIASRFRLTQERIRQIVVKATKQAGELLIEQRKNLEEVKAENVKLKVQDNLLREENIRLKSLLPKEVIISEEVSDKDFSAELTGLLETQLQDIALPLRAVKILRVMGVCKFSDIPQIESKEQVLKMRNSGQKTAHDISELLEDFNLNFGMSYRDVVRVLKANGWQDAKRKWMEGSGNKVKRQTKGNRMFLKTVEVAELTGRPYNEILSLVNMGELPGYKNRRGRWMINVKAVEKHFDIHVNEAADENGKDGKEIKLKTSETVDDEKIISGYTARQYLNCTKAEFKNLVWRGMIKAFRGDDRRWMVSKESVLRYLKDLKK